MSGIERRIAAQRLALAALLPFATLGLSPARAARRPLEVPEGNFRLERVLNRGLADGAAIVVTRHWHIEFKREGSGMTVSGAQVFADVTAPPPLEPLAAIERARSASDLFPLTLDEAGMIIPTDGKGDDAALVRALETGRALVRSLPSASAQDDAKRFMAQLAGMSAGAVSRLPSDLFFPKPGQDTTTQAIALPGGGTGTIAIEAKASAAPKSGLLVSSERRIVTRIEGSERNTAESWALLRE